MRRAAHLYRRAGFAADWSRLMEAVELGPEAAAAGLMDAAGAGGSGDAAAFDAEMERLGRTLLGSNDPRRLMGWWVYRMLHTPDPLTEKMTLLWHGHFATSAAKVTDAAMMLGQNELLRRHALGAFGPLVRAISRDPAMLVWLDSTTNRRIHPNENFARELMELFCLGPGHYSERDIREVARAFTGWELRGGRFRFNRYQHDVGVKRFLGRRGNFDGDDAVRIILEQPAAPRFIAAKLTRYLVAEEPALPPGLIEPLAAQLRDNGFEIGPVVRRILTSNLFYGEHAIGRKVRSPVEMAIGLLRALEGATDALHLAERLDQLGQGLFYPPNVKGWDGGRTWINSSTLIGRANLVRELAVEGRARFGDRGPAALAERHGMDGPRRTVDWLLQLLVAAPPPDGARRALVDLASAEGGDADRRIGRVIHAIVALPEFQLA